MQVTVTIPSDIEDDVKDAMAELNGYDQATHGTKADFVEYLMKDLVKQNYRSWKARQSADTASQSADTKIENDVTTSKS